MTTAEKLIERLREIQQLKGIPESMFIRRLMPTREHPWIWVLDDKLKKNQWAGRVGSQTPTPDLVEAAQLQAFITSFGLEIRIKKEEG